MYKYLNEFITLMDTHFKKNNRKLFVKHVKQAF